MHFLRVLTEMGSKLVYSRFILFSTNEKALSVQQIQLIQE